jgi:hypothetical protein
MDEHAAMLAGARSDEQRADMALHLQRTYGNRYVQRLMESIGMRAKLTVSQPGDVYEQEADRVADAVTKALTSGTQRQAEEEEEELQAKPTLQRQAEEEEELEEEEPIQAKSLIQRQEEEEEEEEVQTQQAENKLAAVSNSMETRIDAARLNGKPMSASVRASLEPQFGIDLGDVRIHSDAESDKLSQQLEAKAFTTGRDIFFRDSAYQPDTDSGKQLIAHELTHVVQQVGQAEMKPRVQRDDDGPPPPPLLPPLEGPVEREENPEEMGRFAGSEAKRRDLFTNPEPGFQYTAQYFWQELQGNQRTKERWETVWEVVWKRNRPMKEQRKLDSTQKKDFLTELISTTTKQLKDIPAVKDEKTRLPFKNQRIFFHGSKDGPDKIQKSKEAGGFGGLQPRMNWDANFKADEKEWNPMREVMEGPAIRQIQEDNDLASGISVAIDPWLSVRFPLADNANSKAAQPLWGNYKWKRESYLYAVWATDALPTYAAQRDPFNEAAVRELPPDRILGFSPVASWHKDEGGVPDRFDFHFQLAPFQQSEDASIVRKNAAKAEVEQNFGVGQLKKYDASKGKR